ncbi:MAG: hypothetical protein LBC71_05440, partial [Oscillospiraceae bacterium]|nr:hypothetical protein [Oscillospiraceae bacterium]
MKHILHLYNNLMNLYGDWGNVAVLERELNKRNIEVVIDKADSINEVDFNIYDFIYIGSGTENSLLACVQDIKNNEDALLTYIESNKPILVTGNSHEIFGKTITDYKGTNHKMLGLLDFETIQENTRITGDCKAKVLFMEDNVDPIVGFINRAGGKQIGNIERPFFIEPLEG